MNNFKRFASSNYYKAHLEDFNPAFKKQLQEFADGNVLFEVMEREVWNKAASDIKGLRKYYEENKKKYTWESSASAIMFTAADKEVAEKTIAQLKTNPALWRQLSESSQGRLVSDSGRFETSQLSAEPNLKENSFTPVLGNEIDQTVTFSYILKLHPAGSIRSFDEARGMVISDYQQVVEDQWIAQLKKKYPVVVNQAVWKEVTSEGVRL
jgi:peptidyl-prolyl cis-trans isomerase SurA